VLALDQAVFNALEPEAKREEGGILSVYSLGQIEEARPELLAIKPKRSTIEYIFTLTPVWVRYVIDCKSVEGEFVHYLDADLFFVSDLALLLRECEQGDCLIIPHHFSPENMNLLQYGEYNVGFVSFRHSEKGIKCLEWWELKCLEWCFDKPEETRYADQKYLEDFSSVIDSVVVSLNQGANAAPYNVAHRSITVKKTEIYVEDEPMVFFHFHGLRQIGVFLYDGGIPAKGWKRLLTRKLIRPYLSKISKIESLAKSNTIVGTDHRRKDKVSIMNLFRDFSARRLIFHSSLVTFTINLGFFTVPYRCARFIRNVFSGTKAR